MSYYRLNVEDDLVSVVYDYDYSDQDRSTFLRDPDDKEFMLRFDSEFDAIQYLNEKIKSEHIHPDYVDPSANQARLFK